MKDRKRTAYGVFIIESLREGDEPDAKIIEQHKLYLNY